MPKIRQTPTQIQYQQIQPDRLEITQQKLQTSGNNACRNESLSETRAVREGFDYGEWRKYACNGKHKGWGKGGKKAVKETLEAEMRRIIEEQTTRVQEQAREAMREEIKLQEIKQEQFQDLQKKEEQKDFNEKSELEKYELKAETLEQNAPREVLESNNKSIAKTFQTEIPTDEHKTPSFTGLLLDQEIEAVELEKNPSH